jgi:hypothetical protein
VGAVLEWIGFTAEALRPIMSDESMAARQTGVVTAAKYRSPPPPHEWSHGRYGNYNGTERRLALALAKDGSRTNQNSSMPILLPVTPIPGSRGRAQ